jgi:hypothetical protein
MSQWNDDEVVNGFDDSELEAHPAPKRQPTSLGDRFLTGLADPIIGAGQIMDKVLVNPIRQAISPGAASMEDVVRQRDADYVAPEGIDFARMGGNLANPLSWAGGGSGVVRAAGNAALQSTLAPVSADQNFVVEKAKQAGTGAVLGSVLSKTMRGFTPTKEAQALIDQGIQPSFGQSMGGVVNHLEQKATSIPLVGDAVNVARTRPMQEFEQKALERITGPGIKSIDEANVYASKLYDEVVPHLVPTKQSVQNVQSAMRNALQNPELTEQNKNILVGLADKHFQNFGKLDGQAIKNLDSEIGYLARKYAAGDPASRTLSDELYNVQGAFRTGLEDGLPAELKGKLQAANRAYAQLIPINKAASQRMDEKLMPRSYQKALAQQLRTDVTRMRPDALVDNAVEVLPSTVPDSGTAGRMLLGGLGSGMIGQLPAYLGAGAVARVGATRPVQRALVGNTAWQRALAPYDAASAAVLAAALRGAKRDE